MGSKSLAIPEVTITPAINLALDTLSKGKQAIVFCNTKRGAESLAEQVAGKVKQHTSKHTQLAEKAESVLSSPTKQCHRLARCLKKGVAFHHAGLHSKQREIVEDNFRNGSIGIICSTPTLAMGLDLPAFRTIIRDLKRFGRHGMTGIPVLEYEQMAGRAGRPGKEDYGEAIVFAQSESEKDVLVDTYLKGDPEEIHSKLAVEPVLRTYVLSLIASEFVNSLNALYDFFSKTFYAFQYEDTFKLNQFLDRTVKQLRDWEFLENSDDFVSASDLADEKLKATLLGKRVAELYLDPYTARGLIDGMLRSKQVRALPFSWLHLVANTIEMRPLLTVRTREYDVVSEKMVEFDSNFLSLPPSEFEYGFEEFLQSVKTAMFLHDWVEEQSEEFLLETYNVRPGEVHSKLDRADWLFYSMIELANVLQLREQMKSLSVMRVRAKNGVREELLPLLKLKGVGRVRARKMFSNGVKSLSDVKSIEPGKLALLIGRKLTLGVKKQVGVEVSPEKVRVKENKRKGQVSLGDFK